MGYNCWICKDLGIVTYNKIHMGIAYEMAVRCSCKVGQRMGDRMLIVNEGLAMKVAEDNYLEHIGIHNEVP